MGIGRTRGERAATRQAFQVDHLALGMPPAPSAPEGRRQAREGLDAIFSPKVVAVIGASPKEGSVGHSLVATMLAGDFAGKVVPVHPSADRILGLEVYLDVEAIPGPVDLAVIAVPAAAVLDVAKACGRKGVRGLLVVSAGFREVDAEGAAREEELRRIVLDSHMRMVGPNCLGIINNSPAVRLNATFGSRPILPGSAALVTQSGAVGIALMEHASHVGLGLSRFASMGNKTDVSGNDLMLLWENDPDVRQILFYLENIGNPRNFVQIARRITRAKPIVVVKSGRTAKGASAASSHTGALSQSDSLVDALFEQCGVLRAQTVEELFDYASVFASENPLSGPRIAIVTNSGGPAILAVDALATAGLEAADFSSATKRLLERALPRASHPTNPVDLLAGATPESFESCLRAVLADDGVDGVVAIWTPLGEQQAAQADAIARAMQASSKPGVAVLFGHGPGTPGYDLLKTAKVPVFTFPENAVRSMGALRATAVWRARAEEGPAATRPGAPAARTVLASAQPTAGGWLAQRDALRLAQAYGIQFPVHAWATNGEEAGRAAAGIGGPVAIKMEAPGLVHKSDSGGVRLGVAPGDAAAAFDDLTAHLSARGFAVSGGVVMAMAPAGTEILIGATQDMLFGPIVACGAGGVYTETLKDVQLRLAPLMRGDAARMVERLRIAPILAGARGAQPSDVPALHGMLEQVAQLALDLPEVQEFEVNPVRVLPKGQGVLALDVRARVGQPATKGL